MFAKKQYVNGQWIKREQNNMVKANQEGQQTKAIARGMAIFKDSLRAVITQKLEEMDEEQVAKAIRGLLLEEKEQKQNLQ